MNARKLAGWLKEALRHHKAGRLDKARPLYEQVLRHARDEPHALHGLGVLCNDAGEPERAVELLRAAIAARPGQAVYHNNLGNALRALGEGDAAERAYRDAISRDPDYALAHYNLGALLLDLGSDNFARDAFERALSLHPGLAAAALALAGLLARTGRIADAEACLDRALAAAPDHPELLCELGASLAPRGPHRRSDRVSRARDRRGAAARGRVQRPRRALPAARKRRVGARVLRSRDGARSGARRGALQPRQAARRSRPRRRGARRVRGRARARAAARRGGELSPRRGGAAAVRLGGRGRAHAAARGADRELLHNEPARGLPALALEVLPIPAPLRLAVARHLGAGIERETAAARARCAFRHAPAPREPERLRVGYVSPDFRTHAVGTLIADLFRHHDRSAVAVHAYSLVTVDDAISRQIRAGVDVFRDVSRDPPEAIARRIHADRIDVLVDLAGYTTYSRPAIFALRPAPVQVHWLGHLGTLGADFLPYILADDRVIPEEHAEQFSETIVALPRGFAPASPMAIAPTPARAELGLPDDAFVFCCMNGLYKLDAETFGVWMRILARVPDSVLWLPDEGSATARANLAREAKQRGVDPARLVFAPRAPLPQYLARYRVADLFLDTFAYNAGATAVGALRAGLPVLTLPGDRFVAPDRREPVHVGRDSRGDLRDARAYEERAVAWATPARRARARARAARRSARILHRSSTCPASRASSRPPIARSGGTGSNSSTARRISRFGLRRPAAVRRSD